MCDQPYVNPRRDGPQPYISSSCHSLSLETGQQTWENNTDSIPNKLNLTSGNGDFQNIDETSSKCLRRPMEIEKPGSSTEFVFGKIAVYLCALINISLGVSLPIALSVMFLDWQEEFAVSRARTVSVTAIATGILFGGALLPGYLMKRWGPRFTVLVGSGLSTLGCLASCFATSITFLILTAGVLGGLGFCFIHLPAIPAVVEAIDPKYRNIAITWCSCGIALSSMILPFLYRYLINRYSWRGTFVFISGICLQTFVSGLVMTAYVKRSYSPSTDCGKTGLHLSKRKQKTGAEDTKEGENDKKEISIDEEFHQLCDEVADGDLPELNNHHRNTDLTEDPALNLTKCAACPRMRNAINHIRESKWKFLIDYMFILLVSNVCTCITFYLSFSLVMMDFARSKGFPGDTTGPYFLFIMFISNLIGRVTMGPLSFIPHLHTIQLMGIFGMISGFGMIMLGNETDHNRIIIFIAIHGYGAGGVLAIYPKCSLDLDSVNEISYPLAFGVTCSMEGLCDLIAPVLLGYAVDITGSYTTILPVLGGLSLVCASALLVSKTHAKYRSQKKTKSVA